MGDNPHLLLQTTVEHLALSAAPMGIALAIALPPALGGAWLFGEPDALARFLTRGLPVQ